MVRGRPIRFYEGFWFEFLRFCHWWDANHPEGISFIFRGLRFHPRLMDLKLTPYCLFFFFFLPVEWKEVTKRFPTVRMGIEGVLLGKHLLQEI